MKQEPVESEEGSLMCERIKVYAYRECSAEAREGVRDGCESCTDDEREAK